MKREVTLDDHFNPVSPDHVSPWWLAELGLARGEGARHFIMMRPKSSAFIYGVAAAATAGGVLLYVRSTPLPPDGLIAVVLLAALGVVAEMLAFLLPNAAYGSMAFVPYLAGVLVVPHWTTLVAVATVSALVQVGQRRTMEKAVFNVAQHALTLEIATLIYTALGGQSFLVVPHDSLYRLTLSLGFPAVAAYGVAFAVNSALVSTAIGLAKGVPIASVWRENNLGTIGVDLLASPLVFVFAWVYAEFGALAAATSWIPILGLRQVHKSNLDLEQTNQELLQLMVKSIEARDPYTSGHSKRVQHYSTVIARAMKLSERDIARIGQAALLHDVGKIHEKYGPILGKADHLSPEEWATMQEHPIDGANLVATMTRLRDLVAPIMHHHENWDGTGYPHGLAGEQIPLAARIIRFADTIDAMVTQRPYRRALGPDEVRAEVVRCRGTQFDPGIADGVLSARTWDLLFAPRTAPVVERAARRSNLRVIGG